MHFGIQVRGKIMQKFKKRSDGRFETTVYVGVKDGKQIRKHLYGATYKELISKADEMKIKLGKGFDVSRERDSFGEWVDMLLRAKKVEISDKKYRAYVAKEKYLESLMMIPISKLRTQDIQCIIYDNLHLAEDTLRQIKNLCSMAVQLAVDNRVIDYNCAKAVKIPKKKVDEAKKRRALTDEERHWITDTPHRAQTAAMIMLFAGLRRGELIPLLWNDIDLKNRIIHITKSVETVDGKMIVKQGAKSEAGVRDIPIPEVLCSYLQSAPHGHEMLVISSARGKMHTDSSWKRLWDSYLNELNFKYGDFSHVINFDKPSSRFAPIKIPFVIPRITPHWLRHTYCTMLHAAGVDVLTAKELLGHSDIKTTLEIYTHLDQETKKRQIKKLNEYLSSDSSDVSSDGRQVDSETA